MVRCAESCTLNRTLNQRHTLAGFAPASVIVRLQGDNRTGRGLLGENASDQVVVFDMDGSVATGSSAGWFGSPRGAGKARIRSMSGIRSMRGRADVTQRVSAPDGLSCKAHRRSGLTYVNTSKPARLHRRKMISGSGCSSGARIISAVVLAARAFQVS